jgi:hypothetical protein
VAKILLIPYGWLGDRFFTTSVATVLKRYMDCEIYFLSMPEFAFMDEVLLSFDSIDYVIPHEKAVDIEFDYVFQMPHTNHAENPVVTFCRTILQTDEFDQLDFSPELIKKETLLALSNFEKPHEQYVTYQIDWQNRTRLNVEYILNKLRDHGISCVPIGKHGLSNQGNIEENKKSFHEALVKIAHANYHLSMLGGTAVMATYVDTPTLTTFDWHWNKHNDYNYDVETFMEWWKLVPKSISDSTNHHMFNPYITEDQFIEHTLNKMRIS